MHIYTCIRIHMNSKNTRQNMTICCVCSGADTGHICSVCRLDVHSVIRGCSAWLEDEEGPLRCSNCVREAVNSQTRAQTRASARATIQINSQTSATTRVTTRPTTVQTRAQRRAQTRATTTAVTTTETTTATTLQTRATTRAQTTATTTATTVQSRATTRAQTRATTTAATTATATHTTVPTRAQTRATTTATTTATTRATAATTRSSPRVTYTQNGQENEDGEIHTLDNSSHWLRQRNHTNYNEDQESSDSDAGSAEATRRPQRRRQGYSPRESKYSLSTRQKELFVERAVLLFGNNLHWNYAESTDEWHEYVVKATTATAEDNDHIYNFDQLEQNEFNDTLGNDYLNCNICLHSVLDWCVKNKRTLNFINNLDNAVSKFDWNDNGYMNKYKYDNLFYLIFTIIYLLNQYIHIYKYIHLYILIVFDINIIKKLKV